MKISTELYPESVERLPAKGQHILGHQDEKSIVVYQAYKDSIADFAVDNQYLGGKEFNYHRMSWIKPNFLWMMYRCGWAKKENQERVLALWLDKQDFENILNEAVFSAFNPKYYDNYDHWNNELKTKAVRLQWDPDHNPYGNTLERRAVQIGMKCKVLENFGKKQIKLVEDITDFVKQQKQVIDSKQLDKLLIPYETIFKTNDEKLNERLGID